ncbi:MAG: sulfotransferase [Planctomycetota bacterium]|jgi:hypothetical protein
MNSENKKKVAQKKKNVSNKPSNKSTKIDSTNERSPGYQANLEAYIDIEEKKSDVICVIGMHRSGTSMVTRLLNLCGLYLGPSEQFLLPNENNPMGYFENEGFVQINNALLTHFGGSWYNPPLFKEDWKNDYSLEQIVQETRALLKTFSKSSQWGWKDPRATVLLPFWKSLIPQLRFVICVRSPLEVARSLFRHAGIPIQKGFYLWNHYMRAAIRDTEGHQRIFTFYEDFFKDASGEINRLIEFCGLQKPDDISSINSAISGELKHHTSETLELLNEDKIISEIKIFYIGLRALTRDGLVYSASGSSHDDLISENISNFFKLLLQFHNEQEMAKLQCALADLRDERDTWGVKAENLEKIKVELEKTIVDKERDLNEAKESIEKIRIEAKESVEKIKIEDKESIEKIRIEAKESVEKIRIEAKESVEKIKIEAKESIEKIKIKAIEDKEIIEKIVSDNKETINNLHKSLSEKEVQIIALKDFEEKVKNTSLYKIYRFIRK